MSEPRPLEQVLADWRERIAATPRGAMLPTDTVEQVLREVADAAEDFLTFISEREAELRSGHRAPWWRARYALLAEQGHAMRRGRTRYYRRCVVPRRADLEGARAAGRRGERPARSA